MGTRLFVGNLSFKSTEDDVKALFGGAGVVKDCHLVTDRDTGRPRGFGFVEMSSQGETDTAITMFNGKDFQGRELSVSEARPRAEGGGGGGGKRW
jgi:RNA recognition motif-containing protein